MCQRHYDAHRRSQPGPECSVDGCTKRAEARGWCQMHYVRWKKYGDVHAVALVHNDPDRRFRESYTVTDSGCWQWTGWLESNGYARFTIGQKRTGAHRWAYERFVGSIPPGMAIDHLCRNRACVNPDHLEPVTTRANLLRGETLAAANAAKTHCKHGHKFTPENTVRDGAGNRQCRECRNRRAREYQARKRQRMNHMTT